MLRKTTIIMTMIVLVVCAGCQSHAQNRRAAKARWDKTSAQIKLSLAQQQYESGKTNDAKKTIAECISADPQMPQAHLLLGKLLYVEQNVEKAVSEFQMAVELDEELDEGWYWLGTAAEERKQAQQAWLYYNNAMTLKPTKVDYILAVVDAYAAQDKPEEAIALLEQKIEAMPTEVSLKVAAADLMCRLKSSERAVKLYKQAMLMTTDNSDIVESLGYCYMFSGEWSQAAEVFNELVKQSKDDQKNKLYLQAAALCSMNSAQYDQAVNCYGKLSVEERDNAEFWVRMGQAALGAGMIEKALTCGRRALALQPGYADAVALTGCAQYVAGDYAAAATSFERITTDKKNLGFSWLMRARCYERLGQKDRAQQAYKKALELGPHSELGDFLVKGKSIRDW